MERKPHLETHELPYEIASDITKEDPQGNFHVSQPFVGHEAFLLDK